jgi:hypothetical protein
MCTKTNTTLLAWVFWLTYHRFIIIIKQTYSYLKAQLMTLIKWGAIDSEYIYWFISIIRIQQLIMLIITRIIINIYIIKKHDPIHINKSNIYNIYHAYGKLSTHLTRKQTEVKSRHRRKSNWRPADRISGLSEYKGDIFKNDSKEHITYLIHLTNGVFRNPICFWTN